MTAEIPMFDNIIAVYGTIPLFI